MLLPGYNRLGNYTIDTDTKKVTVGFWYSISC